MEKPETATGRTVVRAIFFNRWVSLVLRVILGGIFLYAGILKIQSPQSFADNIAGFQLLPMALINLLALSFPVLEMVIGTMLVLGFRLRLAAFSVLVLSVVFMAASSSALARGLTIDCGCFGGGAPSVIKTWLSLGRNFLLIAAAIVVWCQPQPVEK